MANIAGFKGSITTGLVRPNVFTVTLDLSVGDGSGAITEKAQFHCKATSLPASSVAPVKVFYQGRAVNVSGERDFQPWQVMVYNEDFKIRDALMKWQHKMNNLGNNTGVLNPKDYQRNITIEQKDRNGKVIKKITLVDAMPVQIGEIQLDFEANNIVEMFAVVFEYNYFTDDAVNQSQIY